MSADSGICRGLYGYARGLAFLAALGAEQQADILAQLGATVVFGGHEDPMLAAALRTRGIRVMAEFGCFVGRTWWEQYPDSRPLLADGSQLEEEGGYCGVNPAHAAVRAMLLARLRTLLRAQPLDGLWLDFIRWPCHWEAALPLLPATSFDTPTIAAFCRDMDLPPLGAGQVAVSMLQGALSSLWQSWRCQQVTSFAAAAAAIVRELQPDCLVGAFTVPWHQDDWDGARVRIIGQDLGALAAHLDIFSPMVYHRMCGREPAWIASVSADQRAATGKPIWPIVQAVDEPAGLTVEEYRQALEIAAGEGEGVLVYNLRGLEDEDRRMATAAAFTTAA